MFKEIILPIALCLSSSFEALAIHFITSIQAHRINPEQLIIINELLKIGISGIMLYLEDYFEQTMTLFNLDNLHWFFIPALIYTICNNLIYIALKHITPSMFNLLSNFKIPITILLAFVMLRHRFNMYQLAAVIFVFTGNMLAMYQDSGYQFVNYTGCFIMLLYSLCSGIAAVYCEFVMKIKFSEESVFLQNIKFSLCSVICNVLIATIHGNILDWYIEPIHILGIIFMAMHGILTGLVLKYIGSVVKTYSTSASVFVSVLMSYLLWGYSISVYFIFGSVLSFIGINVFVYDKYQQTLENRRTQGYTELFNEEN